MPALKCGMCGELIKAEEGFPTAICHSCGAVRVVPNFEESVDIAAAGTSLSSTN